MPTVCGLSAGSGARLPLISDESVRPRDARTMPTGTDYSQDDYSQDEYSQDEYSQPGLGRARGRGREGRQMPKRSDLNTQVALST